MSFQPANALQSFIPTTINIPQDFEKANPIINDYMRKVIAGVNSKDIGQYNTQELLNGQVFFTPGNANVFRNVFRKVVEIDVPLVAGANTYAHNLGAIAGFTFTRIYGVIQDTPTTIASPIPQGEPGATTTGVSLEVIGANVVVTINAASPYIGFLGIVILEYIKG